MIQMSRKQLSVREAAVEILSTIDDNNNYESFSCDLESDVEEHKRLQEAMDSASARAE